MKRAVLFYVEPGSASVACRSCGAQVIWIVTKAGKRMPVDAQPGGLLPNEHASHFATCPDAKEWRNPR